MPRIQIISLFLLFQANAFAADPVATTAATAATNAVTTTTVTTKPPKASTPKMEICGERLKGFAFYERMEKEEIVKKTAIFEILDWSRNSSFEGIVAKKSETEATVLELEFRKTKAGKSVKKQEAKFKVWPENSEFKIADMDPKAVIGNEKMENHFLILRLKEGKKILCEDAARKIHPGH